MGVDEEIKALQAKLDALTKLITEAHPETSCLKEKAASCGKKIRQFVDDSQVGEKIQSIKDDFQDFEEGVEDTVQRRPILSLLIAFFAGAALYNLFRGRR